MLLDFNNLSSQQKLDIDKIFFELQSEFQNLIENIFKNNKDNTDLLFSNIISRNNDENSIFYSLCLIELSLRLYHEGKVNKIITSNEEQAEILKQKLKGIRIEIKKKKKIKFFQNIYKIIQNIHYVWKLKSCQNLKRKEKLKSLKNIILIEIFFIPNMFSKNVYLDRYYGNLSENIYKDKTKNIAFFPIFFHKAIKKKFINLAGKKINLILQSDYLKLEDYIKSIFYFQRIKKINLNNLKFRGLNIDSLIKTELNSGKLNQSRLIALLNYYCFKRMKEEQLDLGLVIDWYENQVVDKGLNYGKNIFFPKIKSRGYIGSNPVMEVNQNFIPSSFEISKNITPNEICLVSPKYFEIYKETRKDINFFLVPALRSSRLFEEEHFLKKNITNREYSKILINFTGFHLDNLEMINLINKCEALKSEKIHLFIRPHKASKKEIFKKLLSKKINYNFSEKDFYDEMKDTDILISRPNTACFESLIFGVPVLITRRKRSFLPAKTSKAFPSNLWFFTNDSNDLEKNINRIIGDKTKYIVQNVEERKKLLTEYFSPINKENIINLLR